MAKTKVKFPKVEQLGKPEQSGSKKFLKKRLSKAMRRTDQTEKPVRGYRGYSN